MHSGVSGILKTQQTTWVLVPTLIHFLPLTTMNGKSTNGSLGGMACIEGLPPLPKSLSGLLNSSGGSWREMERMYVKKTMIQDDLSRGRNNTDNLLAHKPANLDAALALLRKEMVKYFRRCSRYLTKKWAPLSLMVCKKTFNPVHIRMLPNPLEKLWWLISHGG